MLQCDSEDEDTEDEGIDLSFLIHKKEFTRYDKKGVSTIHGIIESNGLDDSII
jgi:hypothetical protein